MTDVWEAFGNEVLVVLRHAGEEGEFENVGGKGTPKFEAVAVEGTPNDAQIICIGYFVAEGALEELLGVLAHLGFRGRVFVDDLTKPEAVERYEVPLAWNASK